MGPYILSTRFLIFNQGTLKLTPVSRSVLKSNPFPLFQWIVLHLTLTEKWNLFRSFLTLSASWCVSSTCVSAYTFTCLPPQESTLPTLQNEYLSVGSSHFLSSDLFHELFCLFLASLILLSYLAFPYVNKWLMSLPLAREKLNPLTLCIINSPHPSPIAFALSETSLGCATLTSRLWLCVCICVSIQWKALVGKWSKEYISLYFPQPPRFQSSIFPPCPSHAYALCQLPYLFLSVSGASLIRSLMSVYTVWSKTCGVSHLLLARTLSMPACGSLGLLSLSFQTCSLKEPCHYHH